MSLTQYAYPSTPQAGTPGQMPQANPLSGGSLMGPEYEAVPYRRTPPWGEPQMDMDILLDAGGDPDAGMGVDFVTPAPEISPTDEDLLWNRQNLAFGNLAFELDWYLDPQFGYPPPGAPNVQDFQSGHTSITVHNFSAEQGWGADPAFKWMRYPHMENHAKAYGWGILRRNGQLPVLPKQYGPGGSGGSATGSGPYAPPLHTIATWMQQQRDLLVRTPLMHRLHEVIVDDPDSVPNTMNVNPVDPLAQQIQDFSAQFGSYSLQGVYPD
jgi:hypothetical protein